jgi:hypothetical protein
MADRRAGPRQGPYVGKEPRSRNTDGQWRAKRSDSGGSHGGSGGIGGGGGGCLTMISAVTLVAMALIGFGVAVATKVPRGSHGR